MELNSGFIERYQMIFEKDKSTRLFAPLAEAYRKMGLLKEARAVCEEGLKHNPNFVSGQVAYAQVLLDLEKYSAAEKILEKATGQNHENILAHLLLARCLMQLKKVYDALNSYKMVLFLAPEHSEALKQVKKLESLSAAKINDSLFELNPLSLFELEEDFIESGTLSRPEEILSQAKKDEKLDRALSLADAFSVRGDLDKAIKVLDVARENFGDLPAVIKRLAVLNHQSLSLELPNLEGNKKISKNVHKLEAALRRVEQNRRD